MPLTDEQLLSEHFLVVVCCNDVRGHFCGRLAAVNLVDRGGELALELEAVCLDEEDDGKLISAVKVKMSGSDALIIEGRWFTIHERKRWYGNCCWDAVKVSGQTMINLVTFLREAEMMSCDAGWTMMWDTYETKSFGIDELRQLGEGD